MNSSISIVVRPERTVDRASVRAIHTAAFGRPNEAALVDALRAANAAPVSLVAMVGREICGHILFSEVTLEPPVFGLRVAGLAPLAVRPDRQKAGVGTSLVRIGLKTCAAQAFDAVVVLGAPAYYRRFGFLAASLFGLKCEYDVPAGAFQTRELRQGALAGSRGLVRFNPLFSGV